MEVLLAEQDSLYFRIRDLLGATFYTYKYLCNNVNVYEIEYFTKVNVVS